MKQIQYISTIICLATLLSIKAVAQVDPHFTQNYTYPMYINPAMTGGSDGDYRVSAIYRSQWGNISNPFRTVGVSYDARTNKNIALGGCVLNQSAGDGGFNYLTASATVAYTGVKFGKDEMQRLVFAMQGGVINRRVDQTKFKWGEQWNPITGYNPNNAITETFNRTSSTVLDIGAGALYYDASPDKKINVFAGFSAYHLNRPKDPILYSQNDVLSYIPLRYVIHGGININVSEKISVVPHVLFMQQGNAKEIMFGTYVRMNVNEETDFMFGGYYRNKDAAAPYAGIDYKNFTIGVSYDANISKLGSLTRNVNSFELTLTYTKRNTEKPRFDFLHCPRF